VATYNDVIGLYTTVRFLGKNAGAFPGESWQVGLRLGIFADSSVPGLNEGDVQMSPVTVQDAGSSRQITDWDIEQGFTGSGATDVITDAHIDTVANSWGTWLKAMSVYTVDEYELESLRIYAYGEDGKMRAGPLVCYPRVAGLQPAGTAAPMPPDVAAVVSLYTAKRGKTGRGRFYLGGLPSNGLGTNGRIKSADVAHFAQTSRELIEDLRFGGGAPNVNSYAPIVWHRTTDVGAIVNRVRMNDTYDTQRRRDRQLVPTWTEQPLS
jgi:hypothetical protein